MHGVIGRRVSTFHGEQLTGAGKHKLLITKFVIESFAIVKRTVINSDTLDPLLVENAVETLALAKGSKTPLVIVEDPEDPMYLGLGFPDAIFAPDRSDEPPVQHLLEHLPAEMGCVKSMFFYLLFKGYGPVYAVLPAEQADAEDDQDEQTSPAADAVNELLEECRTSGSYELLEKIEGFDVIWDEVLDCRPAVLEFGQSNWGEEWDNYAMEIATAILLES